MNICHSAIISASIVFLLILLIYFIRFPTGRWQRNLSRKSDLSSGSLIFFSGNTFGEKVIRFVTISDFSHVGLLLEEDGKFFILEADIGNGYKDGVRVIPLRDKLNRWRGESIVGIRKRLQDIPKQQILQFARDNFNKNLDKEMTSWLHPQLGNGRENSVFCSELVMNFLIKSGIYKTDRQPCSFSPGEMAEMYIPDYSQLSLFEIRDFYLFDY